MSKSNDLLYREDLNQIVSRGCNIRDCEHDDHCEFFFHCRCDVNAAIEVSYREDLGAIRVGCRECGCTVAAIAVGSTNDVANI
jgi:hypothetical protein